MEDLIKSLKELVEEYKKSESENIPTSKVCFDIENTISKYQRERYANGVVDYD